MRAWATARFVSVIPAGLLPWRPLPLAQRRQPVPVTGSGVFHTRRVHRKLEHQSSHRVRGVHLVDEQDKLDTERFQVIDKAQQVLGVAVRGIEPPDNLYNVLAHLLTKLLQLGAVGTGHRTRTGICEDALSDSLCKRVLLKDVGLYVGSNADMTKFHADYKPRPSLRREYQDTFFGMAFCYVLEHHFARFQRVLGSVSRTIPLDTASTPAGNMAGV